MCGINLIISKNKEWPTDTIIKMAGISRKRGPDGLGFYQKDNIYLAHNLLAITEPPDGKWGGYYQPKEIEENRVLTYNGEIYNYKQLRKNLENEYSFISDSDTEVLLYGLHKEGINFLQKCDGMWAIIWKDNNYIYLARDPSGCKPLYYTQFDENFAASSMISCLLELGISRELDEFAFNLYQTFGYIPGPLTLIKGIKKLTPGQILKLDAETGRILDSYYIEEKIVEQNYNPEELRNKISETVRDCLIGRRKIGLYLSGGLDSSIILTEALKYNPNIETFTTRFEVDNAADDAIFNSDANVAAQYTKELGRAEYHHELVIIFDDFANAVEECIIALEEPRSNPNTPAYYLLNKFVSERDIVVTLSGDGGDEIFGGYKHHLKYRKCKTKTEYLLELYNNRIIGWPDFKIVEIIHYLDNWLPEINHSCHYNTNLHYESLCHLPDDYLIRNDKLGMNFSMEARFPFTCRRLKNYILGIPGEQKFNFKEKGLTKPFKILLKDAYKNILPSYILNKEKSGWAIPRTNYMDKLREKYNYGPLRNPSQTALRIYFDIWMNKFNINCEN